LPWHDGFRQDGVALFAAAKAPPQQIATATNHRADAQDDRADDRCTEQDAGGQGYHKFQRRFHDDALDHACVHAKVVVATAVRFPVKCAV